MATFADRAGDEWAVALDVSYFDRFKEIDLDLDAILTTGGSLGELLFGSVRRLGEVAWLMCGEQAEGRGLTVQDFARRIDGPTAERFGEALVEALADFSPRSAKAAAIKGVMKTVLAEADREMTAGVTAAVSKVLSGSAGNSPG